jgi:SpoVK/Ycf46/Vps4 family AAA+-type ATPase
LRPSIQKCLQQLINQTKKKQVSPPAKASNDDVGMGGIAVFIGADRSEKTMVATILANELNLGLYRIELSRVVSKYIGETEKNLSRIFDDAGRAGAVLFFDEADALFGKRTEVKDAHDRYANRQRGPILARMKRHRGLSILSISRMASPAGVETRGGYSIIKFPVLTSGAGI